MSVILPYSWFKSEQEQLPSCVLCRLFRVLQESSAEAGSSWTCRNILSSALSFCCSQLLLALSISQNHLQAELHLASKPHNLPSDQLKEPLGKSFCARRVKLQQCGRNLCISQTHCSPPRVGTKLPQFNTQNLQLQLFTFYLMSSGGGGRNHNPCVPHPCACLWSPASGLRHYPGQACILSCQPGLQRLGAAGEELGMS